MKYYKQLFDFFNNIKPEIPYTTRVKYDLMTLTLDISAE